MGLCTGALAAAAISSTQELMQLIPVAVHATVIALHLGLRAAQEAQSVTGFSSSSWASMVVVGVPQSDVATALQRFNSEKVLSMTRVTLSRSTLD